MVKRAFGGTGRLSVKPVNPNCDPSHLYQPPPITHLLFTKQFYKLKFLRLPFPIFFIDSPSTITQHGVGTSKTPQSKIKSRSYRDLRPHAWLLQQSTSGLSTHTQTQAYPIRPPYLQRPNPSKSPASSSFTRRGARLRRRIRRTGRRTTNSAYSS